MKTTGKKEARAQTPRKESQEQPTSVASITQHTCFVKAALVLLSIALTLVPVRAIFITPPTPPCEVRVLLDAHTEYDIDTAEVKRLLEENAHPCPYILDITIWDPMELDRVLLEDGWANLGGYTNYFNRYHKISFYLTGDVHLDEARGRDFSVLNSLSGVESGTWVILHELGHMLTRQIFGHSETLEGWCDHFANENYSRYSIIKEER